MTDTIKFCKVAGVERVALETWIEAGWLSPQQGQQGLQFSGVDLVRARLIVDLYGPMGVNAEGIGVILHLLDQIHGLRRALRGTTSSREVGYGTDARH